MSQIEKGISLVAYVVEILLIFILGLTPPILALWITRRAETKAREQLKAVMEAIATGRLRSVWLAQDQNCVGGMGDISCRFNAHSSFLRCAVNPPGPCQDCSNYQLDEAQ